MRSKGLCSALLCLGYVLAVGAMAQSGDIRSPDEFLLRPLTPTLQVEGRCGEYFGYDSIPGTTMKRISFNYEQDGNLFIRTVAGPTIRTEIDDSKETPTVEFVTASGGIIVRISTLHFEKAKDCLPEPEKEK